jgi:hypothetical protein
LKQREKRLVSKLKSIIAMGAASVALWFPAVVKGEDKLSGCSVARRGAEIVLQSPAFLYTLDTEQGLRALSWQNLLAGRQISLGLGPEVALDFDTADRRIWISGWKHEGDRRTTHIFLPPDAQNKKLTLTLGGFGLYDYRVIEVQLNGQDVGQRHATGRWREPGEFNLGPDSKIHPQLRFGEDNILAMQCREPITRTKRMDDLGVTKDLPGRNTWPAQFEQYLTIGAPLSTPALRVQAVHDESTAQRGKLEVELQSQSGDVKTVVTYQWNTTEPVLHKFVEVWNQSPRERRLMNVRLGDYQTDAAVSDGEQGFPVYLGDEYFMSVAHPSGWAIGQNGRVLLRQYPGRMLPPGGRFQSMEVVCGVAGAGAARQTFLAHVRARSRRVLRGQDKPFAIYDSFGANEINGKEVEEYLLNEKYVLEMLDKLGRGKSEADYQFDYCNTHFWVDHNGDLEGFDPLRFPNGFARIKAKLDELGIKPGLWIDSSWAEWSIGGNPVAHCDFTHDPAYEDSFNGEVILCRASDPVRTMYSTAFAYHIREEGVRLIKCDNLRAICYNPNHPHLPGVYSTEAIQSAVIQTMRDWDAANSDVFIMLYWGYRSPWWLLDGDTIFESGLDMEAASPGPSPTLYARDGVTVGLDQGQWWRQDVPPLGKDSLGIWLSDWSWNSHIGKERWQDGFAMDLCRGSMLAQIWTDYDWLSVPERKQLAEFIALLKAQPKCFGNPRFILGNPWKREPYGYSCTDGKRAFLALNNCTWSDATLPLELNSKWGLPDGVQWDIYRWYPDRARLQGGTSAIALRPFEVVLLEAVPAGTPPALKRDFTLRPMPVGFSEPSSPIPLTVAYAQAAPTARAPTPWQILKTVSAVSANGAVLTPLADLSLLASGPNVTADTYTITANTDLTNVTAFRLEVLPDPSLPADGPGRAVNGNFVLSEFGVRAAPLAGASPLSAVTLQNAVADFSQESYGGWPAVAALDGNPATGWQIDPEEGAAHEAIFEAREPIRFPGGVKLAFALEQSSPAQHTLGRFRLSATDAKPPFRVMTDDRGELLLKGVLPASRHGGILVVTDSGRRIHLVDSQISGKEAPRPTPPRDAAWQVWRMAVGPSAASTDFALKAAKGPTEEQVRQSCKAYFIPAAEL